MFNSHGTHFLQLKIRSSHLDIDLTSPIAGDPLPEAMADDQITDAHDDTEETPGGSATFGAFHTGKLNRALNAPSGLAKFTRPHEKATDNEEIKGPEILNWQPVNASSFVMAGGDMKLLHQLMNKDVDRASVQHFDGDPKSLTLHDAVRGPLESANITSQPSNPGAIGNSHKLTDYLSSTEEPLSPINTKERPTATTKKELRPGERKAEAADEAPAKQKVKDRMTKEVVAEKGKEKRRKGKEAQKNAKELLDKARKKKKEGKPEVEKPKSKTKGFKPEKPTPEEPEKKNNHIPDIPIIWQKGDGSGSSNGLWKEFHDYEHYEMDATDAKSIGDTFPPVNVLLSDWWVGIILQSALGGGNRGKMWPCDFNSKGYIRTSRTSKGRAYKRQFGGSKGVQKWYYIVFYNRFQLHGKEGLDAGKIAVRRKTSTTKKSITRGEMAVLQNDDIPSITPGAAESGDRGIKKIEAKSQVPDDCNLIVTKAEAKDKERLRNNHKDTSPGSKITFRKRKRVDSDLSASTSSEGKPWKKANTSKDLSPSHKDEV